MTENQVGYATFAPYNSHYFAQDYIRIQKWGDGYTACIMTEKRTRRLFNYDLDGLWIDIMGKINEEKGE